MTWACVSRNPCPYLILEQRIACLSVIIMSLLLTASHLPAVVIWVEEIMEVWDDGHSDIPSALFSTLGI